MIASAGCVIDARVVDSDAGASDSDSGNAATSIDASIECDSPDANEHYQPCYRDRSRCHGENTACAGYTSEPENTFCAPYCEGDHECPGLFGFEAACNFAWCAVLCDAGECPDGMVCEQDVQFIDRDGADRGVKDVCVSASLHAR